MHRKTNVCMSLEFFIKAFEEMEDFWLSSFDSKTPPNSEKNNNISSWFNWLEEKSNNHLYYNGDNNKTAEQLEKTPWLKQKLLNGTSNSLVRIDESKIQKEKVASLGLNNDVIINYAIQMNNESGQTNIDACFIDEAKKADCNKFEKKYFIPLFTLEKIFNDWSKYIDKPSKYYKPKNKPVSAPKEWWHEQLIDLDIPSDEIIISDNYIIDNYFSVQNNLLPIVAHFYAMKKKGLSVIVISKHHIRHHETEMKKQEKYAKSIECKLATTFKNLRPKVIKIRTIKEKHQRAIYTKFRKFSSDAGLDIIGKNRRIQKDGDFYQNTKFSRNNSSYFDGYDYITKLINKKN